MMLTYRKNGLLCTRLIGLGTKEITKHYHDVQDKKLDHLKTLCSYLSCSKNMLISFTVDAFQDFHQLVLATLIGYYHLLHTLSEIADKEQIVSTMWDLLCMLWKISRS
jgi:hypothetical protein